MRIVPLRRSEAIVFLIALLVRLTVLVGGWGTLAQDDDAYGRLAVYWAETGTYGFPELAENPAAPSDSNWTSSVAMRPTAYRPPLYPWLLSWFVEHGRMNLIAVAAEHLCLGLASVGLTFAIASRLMVRWPALPALAVACDPILLRGSQLVMTETLITFFALAIWALWLQIMLPDHSDRERESRARWRRLGNFALLGLVLGLSVLTRPTMLPWAVCLIGLIALGGQFIDREGRGLRGGWDLSSIRSAAVVGILLLATLSPWVLRNARMLGTPIWTTTHGGYTLLLANNPSLYAHFRSRGPSRDWDAGDFHRHWADRHNGDPTQAAFWQRPITDQPTEPPIDELRDDRLAQRSAKATIAREPAMFALSCLYRIGWFWALAPREATGPARVSIGAWYAIWLACAVWGIIRIGTAWGSRAWLAPAAFVVTLTLVHAVYWSNMRMRAPLMPIVYIVASVPLYGVLKRQPKNTTTPIAQL